MLLLQDLASNTRALLDLETAATELLRLLAMALLADCSDCRILSLPLPTNKTKNWQENRKSYRDRSIYSFFIAQIIQKMNTGQCSSRTDE